ncbi:L,D-transpeptidase family protein [Dendrosporobacter sp. 1207_IL3150]|uniref:L,D-transpeptidase family protein n=1 Tax=Dendrosporobacter sp. 1207_IL3150 TaxID=3084054 RepID=UPI002FD88F38
MALRQILMIVAFCVLFLKVGCVEAASLEMHDLIKQRDMVVVVEKSINKMTVFYQGTELKRFTVVSGVNSQGDKQRQGDNRTPEGRFFITDKERLNDHPYLGRKWLGLSYPDPVHAQRGIENNLININQYREIVRANEQKIQPPQNTALGGWIGIHGGREDLTKERINWTEGCLALQDSDLEELYRLVDYGTPVVIVA